MRGHLYVITGPMFTKKTLDLITKMDEHETAELPFLAFSPIREYIKSRAADRRFSATYIDRELPYMISYHTGTYVGKNGPLKTVFIDEVQFYAEGIIDTIEILLSVGIDVIVAGLDYDFREQPFGSMNELMMRATQVFKHYDNCMKCGTYPATRTQRLLAATGKPAPFNGPLVAVDGDDVSYSYECRCRSCYEKG